MQKYRNPLVVYILLLSLVLAIGYGSIRMMYQAWGIYQETSAQKKDIEALRKQKQELEERLVRLEAPGAIERQAKERLNLKLPGEEVVVVLPDKTGEGEDANQQRTVSFWGRVRRAFMTTFKQ